MRDAEAGTVQWHPYNICNKAQTNLPISFFFIQFMQSCECLINLNSAWLVMMA